MTVAISMYGELFNELRDFHKDREAGVNATRRFWWDTGRHTVVMYILLGIGIISAAITLIGIMIVPFWVLMVTLAVLICLLIPAIMRIARRTRDRVAAYEPLAQTVRNLLRRGALDLLRWSLAGGRGCFPCCRAFHSSKTGTTPDASIRGFDIICTSSGRIAQSVRALHSH